MTSPLAAVALDNAPQMDACTRCGAPFSSGARFCRGCEAASPLVIASAMASDEDGPAAGSPSTMMARAAAVRPSPGHRGVWLRVEEALAQSPLFSLLPPAARADLAAACFRRRYEPGAWITQAGQQGARGFVIATGTAHAYVPTEQGRRVLVRAFRSGDFLGEPKRGGPRRAVAVQAVTPVETYVFASDHLTDLARSFAIFRDALEHHATTAHTEAFLRRASPFAPLPPDVLLALAARMETVAYAPGDTVFSEDGEGDALYIVRHGEVNVFAGGMQVAALRAGDCFGEAALLTHAARTTSVRTGGPTEVLRLDRADFDRISAEYEDVRGFIIELLHRRDLLTPRLARAAEPPAPPLTSAAGAAADVDYRPVWTGATLITSVSALVLVLALTPRGGYLLAPALLSAAAVAPAAAALAIRAIGVARDVRLWRQAFPVLVGALAGLLVLQVRSASTTLEAPLAREAATAFLGVIAQTALLLIVSTRRGLRLEMDGLIAGATAGWGFGVASLLTAVLNAAGGGAPLTIAMWMQTLLLPLLYGLLGARLGAAVWTAREAQRLGAFAGAFLLAVALTFAAGLTAALDIPLIAGVPVLVAATGIALLTVRRRLRPAITGWAAALITLGRSNVLAAATGLNGLVSCRGCGALSPAGAAYCAHCGLSLIEDERER